MTEEILYLELAETVTGDDMSFSSGDIVSLTRDSGMWKLTLVDINNTGDPHMPFIMVNNLPKGYIIQS